MSSTASQTTEGEERRQENSAIGRLRAEDFLSSDPEKIATIGGQIDLYFDKALEIFPSSEGDGKPSRFFAFYKRSIAKRFPDDADIRGHITYFRAVYGRSRLLGLGLKLLILVGALCALAVLDSHVILVSPATIIPAIAVIVAIFVGINWSIYKLLKMSVENHALQLSNSIIQRTVDIRQVFSRVAPAADLEENHFGGDGVAWAIRSNYLTRLLLWFGARMEHLERFMQVEMWRIRRERFWLSCIGGVVAVPIAAGWLAYIVAVADDRWFNLFRGGICGLGLGLIVTSYAFWRTPVDLIKNELENADWVRFSDLELDQAVGDQVARDKERMVRYRDLSRGGR